MPSTRPKILILEDAKDSQVFLRSALSQDFELTLVETLEAARKVCSTNVFDLYLIDLVLPDGESFAFCEELRASPKAKDRPILFISGRSSSMDKLNAFHLGADDYVTKPFDILELKARVNARLRNRMQGQSDNVQFGPFRLVVSKRQAFVIEGDVTREVRLTKTEFQILRLLCERPEVLRTRDEIIQLVWREAINVTPRTVDVHVSHLRKKLGTSGAWLGSRHGEGYLLYDPAKQNAA